MTMLFDAVDSADAWAIRQHQRIADWAYSRWEITPYQIAAQMFGATALLVIAYYGYCFKVGMLPWGRPANQPMEWFGSVVGLIYSAAWFARSVLKHELWKRTKLAEPPFVFDQFLRLNWLVIALVGTFATLIAWSQIPSPPAAMLWMVRMFAVLIGNYFFACRPPTFIERRKKAVKLELSHVRTRSQGLRAATGAS